MTTNEQQELNVLRIFIKHKIVKFPSMKYPKVLIDFLGTGADQIVKNMVRDGFVTDLQNPLMEYEFNEAGKKRYYILKDQKMSENTRFWVPIIISVVALAVAAYSLWLQLRPLPKP